MAEQSKADKQLAIVLVGKSEAGKTTLRESVLKTGKIQVYTVNTEKTRSCDSRSNDKNLKVYDTPGLGGSDSEIRKKLKEISTSTEGRADFLIFCVSVGPGSKFEDTNPEIMQCLTDVFSKKLWQHCMLVFTFSNLAWNHIVKNENAVEKYKAHINAFADKFKKVLQALDVKDQNVITIFQQQQELNPNTIVAIPAGLQSEDPVLPGMSFDWEDAIYKEMERRCDKHQTPHVQLLEYIAWARTKKALKGGVLGGVIGGAVGGAAAGAVAGAVAGVVGGPPGVIAGVVLGAVGGGVVGGAALGGGAAGGGKQVNEEMKLKKAKQEMSKATSEGDGAEHNLPSQTIPSDPILLSINPLPSQQSNEEEIMDPPSAVIPRSSPTLLTINPLTSQWSNEEKDVDPPSPVIPQSTPTLLAMTTSTARWSIEEEDLDLPSPVIPPSTPTLLAINPLTSNEEEDLPSPLIPTAPPLFSPSPNQLNDYYN